MREDSQRRRFKFRRNAKGSNHPMATFFLNPAILCPPNEIDNSSMEISPTDGGGGGINSMLPPTLTSSSSSSALQVLDSETQSTPYSKPMTPGLWKDLFKYQTNVVENTGESEAGRREEDDEQDDEFTLDDEFALVASDYTASGGHGTEPTTTSAPNNSNMNLVLDAIIQDKVLFSIDSCEIITPSTNSMSPPAFGTLEITSTKITFTKKGPDPPKPSTLNIEEVVYENHDHLWACESFPSTTWATDEIINILRRNFHLRNTAIELFLSSRKSVFINLQNKNSAFRFFFVIRNIVKPPYLAPFLGMRPPKMVMKMTLLAALQTSPLPGRREKFRILNT